MAEDDNVTPICAELPLECRGLEQRHRAAINWTCRIADKGVKNSDPHGRNRSSVWSAASPDTAGKLSEAIWRPGRATEISRWWSLSATTGTDRRRLFASRQGRRTRIRNRTNLIPAPFQGAWSCGVVPGGYASLRHRLISCAPPAL